MPTIMKSRQIESGQMTSVDLYGTVLAVANLDGKFYAVSDSCPHAGCSLSKGVLAGTVVTCASDGSQFDMISGHVLAGPAAARVRTYRIQVHGDELSI